MENILLTGGCDGSDKKWAEIVSKTTDYRIINFTHKRYRNLIGQNIILNTQQLMEMDPILAECNKYLGRDNGYPSKQEDVNLLLRRTARNGIEADTIYAVGFLLKNGYVDGGTGWCVMVGIIFKKPVYLYEQKLFTWLQFDHAQYKWIPIIQPPKPTGKFAGVGTRSLGPQATEAIWKLFQ